MSSLKNLVSLKNLSPKNCMVKAKKRLRYVAICGASIWNQFAEQKDQYYLGIDPELLLRTISYDTVVRDFESEAKTRCNYQFR